MFLELSEAAKEQRRAYMREWTKNNPKKKRAYRKSYSVRVAEREAEAAEKQDC